MHRFIYLVTLPYPRPFVYYKFYKISSVSVLRVEVFGGFLQIDLLIKDNKDNLIVIHICSQFVSMYQKIIFSHFLHKFFIELKTERRHQRQKVHTY
jgi:hypothetical protein